MSAWITKSQTRPIRIDFVKLFSFLFFRFFSRKLLNVSRLIKLGERKCCLWEKNCLCLATKKWSWRLLMKGTKRQVLTFSTRPAEWSEAKNCNEVRELIINKRFVLQLGWASYGSRNKCVVCKYLCHQLTTQGKGSEVIYGCFS